MRIETESFGGGDLLPREAARRRVRAAKLDLLQVCESSLMRGALEPGEAEYILRAVESLRAVEVSLGQ